MNKVFNSHKTQKATIYHLINKTEYSLIPGPLSVTLTNCQSVSTEGQGFSWLLNMNITNVGTLQLGPGSFTLDPSAGNVGEHGPGMSVSIPPVSPTTKH